MRCLLAACSGTAFALLLGGGSIGCGSKILVSDDSGGDGFEDDAGDGEGGGSSSSQGVGGEGAGNAQGGGAGDVRSAPCDGGEAWVVSDGDCAGRSPCFSAIQDAIDASAPATTIWVGPGTYLPGGRTHVVDATAVFVCVRSEQGPGATVLDGQELGTTVLGGYHGALWLEGFTVRGGGRSTSSGEDGYGVAMAGWEEVRAWVVGNVIEGNVLGRGGLLITTSTVDNDVDVLVSGNVIRGNASEVIDGAVHVQLNAVTGSMRIDNNLIVDNAPTGLGVFIGSPYRAIPSARLEVVENTIVGHPAGMIGTLSVLSMQNNIAWGNDEDVRQTDYDPPIGVRSNLFGVAPDLLGVNGNFGADPLFVAVGTDYHLQPTSPACGVGAPELASAVDIEGTPRDPARPDLGAHACR